MNDRIETVDALRTKLAAKRTAHAEAQAATELAIVAFDEHGTPAAEKALATARAGETSAIEHLRRAERLLAEAENTSKREEREALEREVRRLQTEFNADAEDQKLIEAECAAFLGLVRAMVARQEHAQGRMLLLQRINASVVSLGYPVHTSTDELRSVGTRSWHPVKQMLELSARGLPNTDLRGHYLLTLANAPLQAVHDRARCHCNRTPAEYQLDRPDRGSHCP
ncbi:MAG: hypothetical protein ABI548_25315 [Polyangiaceae bacterium]